MASQACLIANRNNLSQNPQLLNIGLQLLEYIEAHLRAQNCYWVLVNLRSQNAESAADTMTSFDSLTGLQGPTISKVIPNGGNKGASEWFAINIVVRKDNLTQAIRDLRMIGGSGVSYPR